jgi:hypothetical protein
MVFQFLDVPPELRNLVYEPALDIKKANNPGRSVLSLVAEPAILATCRQVYNEAAAILYHHDFFVELNLFLGARPYALSVVLNGPRLHKATALDNDEAQTAVIKWPRTFE